MSVITECFVSVTQLVYRLMFHCRITILTDKYHNRQSLQLLPYMHDLTSLLSCAVAVLMKYALMTVSMNGTSVMPMETFSLKQCTQQERRVMNCEKSSILCRLLFIQF